MRNLVGKMLSRWAELSIIPEGTAYPVLDRLGERIADAGGTMGQLAFGTEIEKALVDGLLLIRAAFEVFEFDPSLTVFSGVKQEDWSDGLDDTPRHKVRLHVQFGLGTSRRIITTGVVGWQRQHVVAYMNACL